MLAVGHQVDVVFWTRHFAVDAVGDHRVVERMIDVDGARHAAAVGPFGEHCGINCPALSRKARAAASSWLSRAIRATHAVRQISVSVLSVIT